MDIADVLAAMTAGQGDDPDSEYDSDSKFDANLVIKASEMLAAMTAASEAQAWSPKRAKLVSTMELPGDEIKLPEGRSFEEWDPQSMYSLPPSSAFFICFPHLLPSSASRSMLTFQQPTTKCDTRFRRTSIPKLPTLSQHV